MKKLISIFLSFVLIFCLTIPCFCAVTPYGNVTEDTSQIKILIEAMLNTGVQIPIYSWVAYRSGEYEYRLYFNFTSDDSKASRFRYYATNTGYNSVWHLEYLDDQPLPDLQYGTYTLVGNIPFTLGSHIYRQYLFYKYLLPLVLFLVLIISLFVFRVHRRVY